MGEDIKNGAVTPEVGEAPAADTFTNNESVPETPAPEAPEAPADSFEKKPEEETFQQDIVSSGTSIADILKAAGTELTAEDDQ